MIMLTKLEYEVVRLLLEGDDEVLSVLRKQFEVASVLTREMTGVGFYTAFKLECIAPCIRDKPSFKFGDVSANIDGLNFGAGFLLYIKDGFLEMLEGYTYDEPWPCKIGNFELSYISDGHRDMTALRKNWITNPGLRQNGL